MADKHIGQAAGIDNAPHLRISHGRAQGDQELRGACRRQCAKAWIGIGDDLGRAVAPGADKAHAYFLPNGFAPLSMQRLVPMGPDNRASGKGEAFSPARIVSNCKP